MTYPQEQTEEWDPPPAEESASLFLLLVHAASGPEPEGTQTRSNAATLVHSSTIHSTRDFGAELSTKMLKSIQKATRDL